MAGNEIRWNPFRRTNRLADTGNAFSEWESRLLDSLHSIGAASADRWRPVGPFGAGTQPAVESGWLLRVAPTALISDVELPDLGRIGAGRQVAIQHSGGVDAVIRMRNAGRYVAACTRAGEIATAVWDGSAWQGMLGAVRSRRFQVATITPVQTGTAVQVVPQALNGLVTPLWALPSGIDSVCWGGVPIPDNWIGTDLVGRIGLIPLAAAAGTTTIYSIWTTVGEGGAPNLGGAWSPAPTAGSTLLTTTIAAGDAYHTIWAGGSPFAVASPVPSLTTLTGTIYLGVLRVAAGNTYTTTYAGTANNLAINSLSLEFQVRT